MGEDGLWHFRYCIMRDEHGEDWSMRRGFASVPIYSSDGNGETNYAADKIAIPQRLILRETGMDEIDQSLFHDEFDDRVIL